MHFRGVSGAGKSSFLRMLVGLSSSSAINRNEELSLAYMPQDLAPMKGTLLENALLFDPNFRVESFKALAQSIDLRKRLDDSIENLSGGELQKFYLILVLSSKADIIVLDEPVSAMDSLSIDLVLNTLDSLESGVFIVAHNINRDYNKLSFYDIKGIS